MNSLPIIQTFFDTPVRFFKAEFAIEMRSRHGVPILIETYAVPFPDFCRAVSYREDKIRALINRSNEVFKPFYKIELIPDALGRLQKTIVMAQEMCDMLMIKIEPSRIKDVEKRTMIIDFQKWVMYAFHLIRTGRLRPARWNPGENFSSDYLGLLSLPPGRETKKAVLELVEKESKSYQTIYRRLQKVRGSNAITGKGLPKKTRSDKGRYCSTPEFKTVEFIFCQNPKLEKKEIARIAGVPHHRATRWLRAAQDE